MTAAFGKKTKGCFSSKARFFAVSAAFCSSIASKSQLPIVYTGFVQRGLPRSSPKNAAAPLYESEMSVGSTDGYLANSSCSFQVLRAPHVAHNSSSWFAVCYDNCDGELINARSAIGRCRTS